MEILRYAAFSSDPLGGNPAGVVLDSAGASTAQLQAVAAEVGYAETAFLTSTGDRDFDIRYFSPLAEVPFCGHATIAAAIAFAERHGCSTLRLRTSVGLVEVLTSEDADGVLSATLTTVAPRVEPLPAPELDALLACLGWTAAELDPSLPPRIAFAGAFHPIIAAITRDRLARLDYDFDALADLMATRGWTTIDLVWRESEDVFHARNAFPPGGFVEDPATGAAAAAFGGYLRALDLVAAPARITIHQGDDLGRPGLITVDIPAEAGSGISVTGTAVAILD